MEKFVGVYDRWERKELTQAEAAEILGKSERQFRRYAERYEEQGLDGLRDRRLGRPSGNAAPEAVVDAILALYRRDYMGWNVRHFHSHLVKRHGYTLSYSTVKNRLQDADLVRVESRPGGHRRKRERKPCVGMMLHQDGSRHGWLDGLPALDLIVTMDDATNDIYSAFFVEEEGTQSTFRALLEVFETHGVPSSLYTDRGSHYFVTPEAGGPVDKINKTQVGRALSHLGVEHIAAYSPEARGRSERMFGTLQRRLVNELRLAGIRDIEAANRWLQETYLPRHNAELRKEPALPESGFVKVAHERLVETLCIEETRTVGRDNTIAWDGRRLQIPESPMRRHYVGATVKVHHYPDGTTGVLHGPRVIARYDRDGKPIAASTAPVGKAPKQTNPAASSVAPRSVPSRRGLAKGTGGAPSERRPASTGPRRGAAKLASRKAKRRSA